MEPFLSIQGLSKSFNKVKVLNNISFSMTKGQQAVLQGASGSGKSTLLYIIGGLDAPLTGNIFLEGENIVRFNDQKLAEYRNKKVGFVFQFHYLLSSLNCMENILLPARIGNHQLSKVKDRTYDYAGHLDIQNLLSKFPHQLSGGEQQRVNILRAISLKPELLLCDEPTGNLDSLNSLKVNKLLKELAKECNSTMLVVTHDNEIARTFDQHFEIQDGNLV